MPDPEEDEFKVSPPPKDRGIWLNVGTNEDGSIRQGNPDTGKERVEPAPAETRPNAAGGTAATEEATETEEVASADEIEETEEADDEEEAACETGETETPLSQRTINRPLGREPDYVQGGGPGSEEDSGSFYGAGGGTPAPYEPYTTGEPQGALRDPKLRPLGATPKPPPPGTQERAGNDPKPGG
jgi:hypothetical protein